jgi:hypothetical protein
MLRQMTAGHQARTAGAAALAVGVNAAACQRLRRARDQTARPKMRMRAARATDRLAVRVAAATFARAPGPPASGLAAAA